MVKQVEFMSACVVALGAAYGTGKSGKGMISQQHGSWLKSLIPVIMSGVIAIYGLIVSVIIAAQIPEADKYSIAK